MGLRPTMLDHVALHAGDADVVAARVLAQLPFRVIEESDDFVLLGRDPKLGKLTLFHSDPGRQPGELRSIGIGIPCAEVGRSVDVGEHLVLDFVPTGVGGEVEVVHLALLTPDPAASARAWLEFGFEPAPKGWNEVRRVRVGHQYVELWEGDPGRTDRPLLNHVGLLVESLDEVRRTVENRGGDVTREVDADQSRALFLRGPDGVQLEYIEHKPSFALA